MPTRTRFRPCLRAARLLLAALALTPAAAGAQELPQLQPGPAPVPASHGPWRSAELPAGLPAPGLEGAPAVLASAPAAVPAGGGQAARSRGGRGEFVLFCVGAVVGGSLMYKAGEEMGVGVMQDVGGFAAGAGLLGLMLGWAWL